jgi:hypothetical protein
VLRAVVACLTLTACNQIYGLDQTRIRDASLGAFDMDEDGVGDSTDNCIAVANTSQSDIDHDQIGDACDACSFGFDPALDRDADMVAASSDNCAGMPNAAQTDGDGDSIGDACDPNPAVPDTRRCFADFWINVLASWNPTDPWKFLGTDESSVLLHSPADGQPFWLGAVASGVSASHVAVQLQLQPPNTSATTIEIASGIAVAAADQTSFAACELVRSGTSLRLRISDSTGADEITLASSAQQMYVTLEYRRVGASLELRCTSSLAAGTREVVTRTTGASVDPSVIYLTATNTTNVFRSLAIYDTAQ